MKKKSYAKVAKIYGRKNFIHELVTKKEFMLFLVLHLKLQNYSYNV